MRKLNDSDRKQIEDRAYEIRKLSVAMIAAAGWGHIGGALSLAEILSVLFTKVARVDPASPEMPTRDRIILSKAHSSPAMYAALASGGFFPVEKLFTYCRINGLDGHQDKTETPGVECSGGSLGLGLSYSVGLAYGMKLKEQYASRVWCIIGDGETNEGQVWEAAMAAGHYGLDNLIVLMDYNKVMAKGFLAANMGLEPIADKWRAFGWTVLESDGHDIDELYANMMDAKYRDVIGKPICLISHTVKGHGLEEAEFNYKWHTHAPVKEKAEAFLAELARRYGKTNEPYGLNSMPGAPAVFGVTEADVSLENLIESSRE